MAVELGFQFFSWEIRQSLKDGFTADCWNGAEGSVAGKLVSLARLTKSPILGCEMASVGVLLSSRDGVVFFARLS